MSNETRWVDSGVETWLDNHKNYTAIVYFVAGHYKVIIRSRYRPSRWIKQLEGFTDKEAAQRAAMDWIQKRVWVRNQFQYWREALQADLEEFNILDRPAFNSFLEDVLAGSDVA